MLEYLEQIFLRDIAALRRQVEAYASEADMWRTPFGIANSGGNLALHLAGNLRFLLGAQLGDTGYVRNREFEFSARNVPRALVLAEIDDAAKQVEAAFARLDNARLDRPYPLEVMGVRVKTGDFVLHLASHLAYHLGQIDYHRRLVTRDGAPVGAMNITELRSAKDDR